MVDLDETDHPVWNNNRPERSAKETINDKTNTANHVDNSDFSYIFQYETQYDKNWGRISDVSSNFRAHEEFLMVTNLIIFKKIIKFFTAIKSLIDFW